MIVEYIRYDLVAQPFIGKIAQMRHYAATPLVWTR
jgi:hypothetical protein